MVQKKVYIPQEDDVKFNKLLKNLKPSSSFQHQESMNRGTDMMKIMKKQRQNLCNSPSFRKQISQPGKPPPSSSPSKMQSLVKVSEKKPNYMKPTTSSDARKENFKKKKNGKSKTPSKLASALTKTTSFKATATSKKSYPFVENVEKPTCSSILKDSKFPVFLRLNSGGTESEGTSIIKVCSYTYCSLNGHHHPPLPPLKSFLSARRHILKTQRSIKMGSLSPRKENETLQVSFQEGFSKEDDDEFFIRIYTEESEDCADNNKESFVMGEFSDAVINAMEVEKNQGDEEESIGINMEGHATLYDLYLDDHNKPVEIENKYFEDTKLDEMMEESVDEETIAGLDIDSDQDFKIEEISVSSNMQSDDEIDNTKFMKTEVGLIEHGAVDDHHQPSEQESETEDYNQELLEQNPIADYYQPLDRKSETEDENQELQKNGTVDDHHQPSDQESETEDYNEELQKQSSIDDHYQPSDLKSATEDENQGLQEVGDIGDYYQPSDQKSESKNDNLELRKQSSIADDYQPSDRKSETEDENQELQKDRAVGDYYPPFDQKSESQNDNQELQKQSSIADHYQPSDRTSETEDDNQEQRDSPIGNIYQSSESDCIDLQKTDESTPLSTDSQSNLTENISPAFKKMHTVDIDEDVSKNSRIGKWIYKQKEPNSEENELKVFNPRGPNFLEVETGPESEKVDLKHRTIDDRRNSEEWMLDYALQQAVNKLAAARKKKVTLLVEAFETVSPLPKWEKTRMGVGFDLQHRIQACR